MTIPDPTLAQQSGIDAAVQKANAPIIAANQSIAAKATSEPETRMVPDAHGGTRPAYGPYDGGDMLLYTSQSYTERCISQMWDSWTAQANREAGIALLDAALKLPDETRLPLLAKVRELMTALPKG